MPTDEEVKCPACGHEFIPHAGNKVEWYSSGDLAEGFYFLAKFIDGARVLGTTGHMEPKSYCEAIEDTKAHIENNIIGSTNDFEQATEWFQVYFRPTKAERGNNPTSYWWGDPKKNTEQEHNARIMAVQLFALMIDDDMIFEVDRSSSD